MNPLDWLAPIRISGHALMRYRERIGDEPPHAVIRGEIRLAILTGRGSDRQPNWTRGIGSSGEREEHVYYLWDKATTRCWVVARPDPDGPIVVKSVVAERGLDIARADARRLRTGMVRT